MPNYFRVKTKDINKKWIKKNRVPQLIVVVPDPEPEPILRFMPDVEKPDFLIGAPKGNKNGKLKCALIKAEKKDALPEITEPYDQSKVLVRFWIEEESEPSPLYNLRYPKSMLINK